MRSSHAATQRLRGRTAGLAFALAVAGMLVPSLAQAQDWSPEASEKDDGSKWSVRGSFGMTASPETFNMTLEVPWKADELVSAGPLVQLGFADDNVLFATTLQAYLTPRLDGELADWHPYAHMGLGFIYLEDDDRRPGRDDEDGSFLFTIGTGVDYALAEHFYMGTGLLFNVIPTGAVGNKFVFGWQILTFRHEF
jgi:hypothetical protein